MVPVVTDEDSTSVSVGDGDRLERMFVSSTINGAVAKMCL